MLVAVTDHAADRFRQRVRGTLSPKTDGHPPALLGGYGHGIPAQSQYEKAQYRQLHYQALTVNVGTDTIEVAPLVAIIRSKEIAYRPKDREALPELYQLAADQARGGPDTPPSPDTLKPTCSSVVSSATFISFPRRSDQ